MTSRSPRHVAPLPPNEEQRLRSLRGLELLDTDPEAGFDDVCALASQICGTPIALVSLIDAERQWFKSNIGLPDRETPREHAICAHAILDRQLLEITDTRLDMRTATNPLVTGDPKLRFYAGAPLCTSDGHAVGTLCVIDREPRVLTDAQRSALRTLADQIETQLNLREVALELARRDADLRLQRDVLARSQDAHGQFLQKILAETPISIFTLDIEGRYVLIEGGTLASHGHTTRTLFGRSVRDVFEHQPEALALLERGLAGETLVATVPIQGFVYEVRLAPLIDESGVRAGVLGLAVDITDSSRAAERLEVHRRVRDLLAGANSLHEAAPEILRTLCRAGRWGGGTVWTFQDGVPSRDSLALDEPPVGIDFVPQIVAVSQDGQPRWLVGECATAVLFAIRSDDETIAVVELHTSTSRPEDAEDLASMVRLGQQMGEHIVRRRAQEDLRVSLALRKLRDEMAAMIVHDLKNPMAAVLGNLDYLLSLDGLSEEMSEAAQDAHSAATRTLRLVMGLLTEVRLEAGTLDIRRRPLELAGFLRGIVGPRRRMFERYEIELVADVSGDAVVDADAELLGRVVENLLDNAHRHTRRGGKVRVATEIVEAVTRITVSNTGTAIPEDVRELIFGKFSQASPSRQGRGNLGLGLYFCRTAVDAHNGVIRVESEEAWPVKFVVELPR